MDNDPIDGVRDIMIISKSKTRHGLVKNLDLKTLIVMNSSTTKTAIKILSRFCKTEPYVFMILSEVCNPSTTPFKTIINKMTF